MKKIKKYEYLFVVQGNYGFGDDWEDVAASLTYREAREDLKAHRENESYPFRLIRRRELTEEYKAWQAEELTKQTIDKLPASIQDSVREVEFKHH